LVFSGTQAISWYCRHITAFVEHAGTPAVSLLTVIFRVVQAHECSHRIYTSCHAWISLTTWRKLFQQGKVWVCF
jgi:hypothetical protein